MTSKRLTPEQEAIVLERRLRWREGLLKALAAEFGCSQSTIRRVEREYRKEKSNGNGSRTG
jgi:hypothetical protein